MHIRENPTQDKEAITFFVKLSLQAGAYANLMHWGFLIDRKDSPMRLLMDGTAATERHFPAIDQHKVALVSEWMRIPANVRYAGLVLAATENMLHLLENARDGRHVDADVSGVYGRLRADTVLAKGLSTLSTEGTLSGTGEKEVMEAVLQHVLDNDGDLAEKYGRTGTLYPAFSRVAKGMTPEPFVPTSLSEKAIGWINRMIGRIPALRPLG